MEERQSQRLIVEQLIIELSSTVPMKKLQALKEYFADQCDVMRLTTLREQLRDIGFIDQLYYQQVPCDDSLITCHQRQCTIDGITFTADTDIFEVQMPNLVTGVYNKNIKSVSDSFGNTSFTRVSYNDFINFTSQYTKPGPIYTVIGMNKMFLRNLPTAGMKFLSVWALLASPKTACNWKNTDYYPVPSIYKLKLLVKKDFLSTMPEQQTEKDDNDKEDN